MEQRTNALAGSPAAGADHGITIVVTSREDEVPFSWPWRASCLCGWQSPAVPSRPQAAGHGEAHLMRVTTGTADAKRDGAPSTAAAMDAELTELMAAFTPAQRAEVQHAAHVAALHRAKDLRAARQAAR